MTSRYVSCNRSRVVAVLAHLALAEEIEGREGLPLGQAAGDNSDDAPPLWEEPPPHSLYLKI